MALTNHDFYYCYSPRQKEYLDDLGFEYITVGRHVSTMRQFWQYESTAQLNKALREFIDLKLEAKKNE